MWFIITIKEGTFNFILEKIVVEMKKRVCEVFSKEKGGII